MSKKLDVKVPDIGDYHDVPVIEVLVQNGDTVAKDQTLMVLESDKAMMEVPSPAAGVVRNFKPKMGDKLSQGSFICELESEAGAPASGPPPASAGGGKEGGAKPAAAQTSLPLNAPTPAGTRDTVPGTAGAGARAGATPPAPTLRDAVSGSPPRSDGGGSSSAEIRIPDIGDYKGVPVIEVLVKAGDVVAKDQTLIVLESDKAMMEVPAPAGGTLVSLNLKQGDKVSQGDVIGVLQSAGAAPQAAAPKNEIKVSPPPASAGGGREGGVAAAAPTAPTPTLPRQDGGGSDSLPYAGPATRKFARQLGVDLGLVKGSGPRGRIVIEDVQAYVKQQLAAPVKPAAAPAAGMGIPPIPAVDFSQFGAIETKPLARIRKISAAHLHRSWLNIPHVTQNDEADITDVEAFRKSSSEDTGVKLTMLPFIMKAVSKSLLAFPEFNASLAPDGESLILKKYVNVGFAADTPNGLVVPVIRDVDKKGVTQLAQECGELAKKARDGKLKPDEMKGGCFSISSLGGIGGSHFTPIVNAPEVAILGASKAQMKPVWDGKAFQPRLMLPLSLSYDHRVIDGAAAARFIVHLVKLLSDVRRLAL